jgi:hypothetical protein
MAVDSLQQVGVPISVEGVGGSFAGQRADSLQLGVGEVETVHGEVRDPIPAVGPCHLFDECLHERGLPGAWGAGYSQNGAAPFDDQVRGKLGEG